MRIATTFALTAASALALAACGGEMTDDEVPYNEGNSEVADTDEAVSTEEAIPAPDSVEDEVDVPPADAPGVTPNTVEGVGSDAEIND